jgi:hypothetical protein
LATAVGRSPDVQTARSGDAAGHAYSPL